MVPLVGRNTPVNSRMSVVLPAPFAPSSPNMPGVMVRSTRSSAGRRCLRNRLPTPAISMITNSPRVQAVARRRYSRQPLGTKPDAATLAVQCLW